MYDDYAKQLIDLIPDLPEIDRDACRRDLSIVYFYIIRSRLGIAENDNATPDLDSSRLLLRRMADTLESIAVFDRLYGQVQPTEIENACAFVAAESLALLATSLPPIDNELISDALLLEANYVSIESALLYMIGGYDSNAASIVRNIKIPEISVQDFDPITYARQVNAIYILSRIISLCQSDVRRPRQYSNLTLNNTELPSDYNTLLSEIRARLYERLGFAIDSYLDWLGGYEDNGLEAATTALTAVREASIASGYPSYSAFSDVYHLSNLLLVTINRTSERSIIKRIRAPINGHNVLSQDFTNYLQNRARGDNNCAGHPFLWPSALQYVDECLPGPSKDSVISMPTGSGKSFIAELAIAHALCSGWVLYIAPTNALAHQVRRDLYHAFSSFTSVISIRAFVGNEEYTTLSEEQVNIPGANFVAVMTPEKCALALRLFPEQFANCSLCVFDECHLLNDPQRGVTADILIAQLSIISPNIRFMLMSAMVSNPDELVAWLRSIRNEESIAITLKWRPSRTMRGLLVLNQDSLKINFEQAKEALERLPPHRKHQLFEADLALIVGLSGPWTREGPLDYRVTGLPILFPAKASKGQSNPTFDSWKNTSSRLLAEKFALSGIPVICFMLTSRHHAFSSAEKALESIPPAIPDDVPFPPLVESWLTIAEYELGVQTALRNLLRHGITVHTSALLPVEHAASEWMFLNHKVNLMFATGTLAQGLNLPAVAVIVAGTSIGDPRFSNIDTPGGISRANAFILNGFGRAGRPGFSNQGIAVLVSDNPYSAPVSSELDPVHALDRYEVLGEPDAAIEVHSPVERFLDNLIAGEMSADRATKNELVLTSLLAESHDSGNILYRTLAAYHKRETFTPQVAEQAREQIARLREEFLQQPNVPDWLNSAAMKAGADFFRTWRIWTAYEHRGLISVESGLEFDVIDWLKIFFEVMALLPPKQIAPYLPSSQLARSTVLTRMRDCVSSRMDIDEIPWDIPDDWFLLWHELNAMVLQFMHGATYASIAQAYLGLSPDQVTDSRSKGDDPIPSVLSFVRNIADLLAIDAGCFVALHELAVNRNTVSSVPETLQGLPLCIRNGCDSLGSLSWYRFGYRQRLCAHALERVFPVPREIANDTARANWVRQTRREWLSGRLAAENEPVLAYARTVIQETGFD